MKSVIIGHHGQLARALRAKFESTHFKGGVIASFDRSIFLNFDLLEQKLKETLQNQGVDTLINAAAYTQVDLAESHADDAHRVNYELPQFLAKFCQAHDLTLVHYSTDYVYGESLDQNLSHLESDPTMPLSVYGKTKLLGDQAVMSGANKYFIFRTSWVFDESGKNFVNTMLRLAQTHSELKVVSDQWGAPTYAHDLASLSLQAIQAQPSAFGLYHLTNSGFTNWSGFAEEIFKLTNQNAKVIPILTSDYPTPAKRPKNSRLSLNQFIQTFGLVPRSWQEALQACIQNQSESKK